MTRFVLRLCLFLLLLFPCAGSAAPSLMPYAPSLCISYDTLTPQQQRLFDLLYDSGMRGEVSVTLPAGSSYADTGTVMQVLLRDCPELCALARTYAIEYLANAPDTATAVEMQYAQLPSRQESLLARAGELAAQAQGSPWEQALWLHDALCLLVQYDPASSCPYTAYGALIENRAVCEGYAQAMALLCRLRGIPCSVVVGESMDQQGAWQSHAWNLLCLEGGYTLCDVTWDDQQTLRHVYFGLTDAMFSADHRRDAECAQLPPARLEGVSWYEKTLRVVPENRAEREQFWVDGLRRFARSGETLEVRFASRSAYEQIAGDVNGLLEWYNGACGGEDAFYGAYRVAYSDAQLCLAISR